jgi:hypothetical protein
VSRIIHRPTVEWHPCDPGLSYHEQRPWNPGTMLFPDPPSGWYISPTTDELAGTVAQCGTCGQTWVVVHVPTQESKHTVWMAHNVWCRETLRQRRKRERRMRGA